MELFAKKKPLRGIIEPPKAISPAPLAPLLNGHLISVYHHEPMERLHLLHFVGHDLKDPAKRAFDPEKVTIEFAFPKSAHVEEFENNYKDAVEFMELNGIPVAITRHLRRKEYEKREEPPIQWQFDERDKKEIEKMEKLRSFDMNTLTLLGRTYSEKKGFDPELKRRIIHQLRIPLLMRAAGYNIRVGDYDMLKKIRAEDAAKGIATPHRITVHLTLTKEDAILTDEQLFKEHLEECKKCSAYSDASVKAGGGRSFDPSCPNRLLRSFFGFPEKERLELRKKMIEDAKSGAKTALGDLKNAATAAKARA
jgi:hypothetical protein